ncbi:MAG: heavy metal-responsive transcriptional regulator [Synechococcales cyanobacterium RM1_1_8]|nr:heavy metal-responsive transcriptional regulator [Synechococcales cyanobacterium RM1_1_8]
MAPTSDAAALLRIGQLKDRSQVSIKTIRYYEELGLLTAAQRSEGGFRLFSPTVVARLAFIKRSQQLGLSLQEIGELLQIRDRGQSPCQELKHKLQDKVREIDHKIAQLSQLKGELEVLMQEEGSAQAQAGVICPIIEHQSPAGLH